MSSNKDSFNVADLSTALNAEDRADLVNALKVSSSVFWLGVIVADIALDFLECMVGLESQHDDLEAKFFEERAALEAKYQKLYQPLYTKRYEIVTGAVEVEGGINDTEATNQAGEDEKGVPDFWLTAMKNNEVLAEEISERDEGALKFLKDIKWSRIDNPKGFKLDFSSTPILSSRTLF
ncbi:Nucleosome assembly protein 1 [Sesamum angolense]|uniref:Nucleosome assembly protein 1 n=1 Tax=Sesamum angolense TaxID=2727404 RepID=A0AAE1WEA8_9LAMI|nr:Nucleosome assembly protein 1 [Sesamum angolense]